MMKVEQPTVEPIPALGYVLSNKCGECVEVQCEEDVVNLLDLTSCVVIM